MKPLKKSIFAIFLLFFASMMLFAQNNCSTLFTKLEKKGLRPQAQPLTAGGTNNLPYNIIVNFRPKDTKTEHNLILLFDLKQANTYFDNISSVFEDLENQDFNSSVVFCYGSQLDIPRDNIIYGSEVYAGSLSSDGTNDVFIFNLSATKNAIIPGNKKNHSPSWMLKTVFDAFVSSKITDDLPLSYVSQISDFTFINDRNFLSFLDLDIPCIAAHIRDPQETAAILRNCIYNYSIASSRPNDSHSFMFRIFNKQIWFSEFVIINGIIISIILGFLLVFVLGFINKTLKHEFWQEISTIWYALPLIYILSYCGFFIGRGLYRLFTNSNSLNYTVYGFIILQAAIATLMVSGFFMLNLSLQKNYTTRSLDFLLVINTFLNLVIFTLLDISLFPIFLIIYIVAVISLIFRRNWIHIILFIFLVIPFIPYINALFAISDKQSLHNLLLKSNAQPFLLSLVILPVYLMWLRILNSMKKRYTKKRIYACVIAAAYLFIILSLIIINKVFYSNKKDTETHINIVSIKENSGKDFDFSLTWNDHFVFDDIIRQIKINSSELPVYTCVKVNSTNPILYSENDYKLINQDEAEFLLPLYPASQLEFNYGTDQSNQVIQVEQIFYSKEDNIYYSLTKTLNTGENQ